MWQGQLRKWAGAGAPRPTRTGGQPPHAASRGGAGLLAAFWQSAHPVARARVLLAFGNALVIYLDPSLPPSGEWPVIALTYVTITLLIAYSLWVWRQELS